MTQAQWGGQPERPKPWLVSCLLWSPLTQSHLFLQFSSCWILSTCSHQPFTLGSPPPFSLPLCCLSLSHWFHSIISIQSSHSVTPSITAAVLSTFFGLHSSIKWHSPHVLFALDLPGFSCHKGSMITLGPSVTALSASITAGSHFKEIQ